MLNCTKTPHLDIWSFYGTGSGHDLTFNLLLTCIASLNPCIHLTICVFYLAGPEVVGGGAHQRGPAVCVGLGGSEVSPQRGEADRDNCHALRTKVSVVGKSDVDIRLTVLVFLLQDHVSEAAVPAVRGAQVAELVHVGRPVGVGDWVVCVVSMLVLVGGDYGRCRRYRRRRLF